MKNLFSKDNKLVQMGNSKLESRWLILFLTWIYPWVSQLLGVLIGLIFFSSVFTNNKSMTMQIFILFPITIIFYILVSVIIDRRKIRDLGLPLNKGFFFDYLKGFFFGVLMISICFIVIVTIGGGKFKFNGISVSYIPTFMFIILTWIIQTFAEELSYRGYTLPLISKRFNIPFGIIVSTILFTVTHFGNKGISAVPVLNLVLFGIFTALYALYTGNIWGVAALHAAWNFSLGNLYGFIVSGATNLGHSIITTSYTQGNLISGGDFGPEGSITISVIIFIGIVILLLLNRKRKNA